MRFSGKIYKNGKFWLAEIPILDVMTQGHSRKEAFEMVGDLIETMADKEGFHVSVYSNRQEYFEIGSEYTRTLVSILLQRKRELSGLSLAQVVEKIGTSSRKEAFPIFCKSGIIPMNTWIRPPALIHPYK
ncbi:MAG: hypothetical protein K8F52_03165 [Candidatus Scalindua rubra]|nr:hypothetical protein [Candidatus Scalindua rubra]TWU35596.1 hypothetical protein S225a_09630 [Candidatus Brocadiaceae bacterium S225]